jgi:FAD/FMN-containing dehydrogenase
MAAEIVSPAFATGLDIATSRPVLLVRFAGNEVGVKYQIQRALALTDRGEVIAEDATIWKKIAAAPLQDSYLFSWRASMLPTKLAAFVEEIERIYRDAFVTTVWQIGAADGRVRMLDNVDRSPEQKDNLIKRLRVAVKLAEGNLVLDSETHSFPSDFLTQRVKQQLDPLNIFRSLEV